MKDQIIRDICAYIKFLEQQGLTLSVSLRKDSFAAFAVELLQYDLHPHPVCHYLKQNPGTEGRCVHNKAVLKKRGLKKPRYGCCYAGVEEYLFPLYHEDKFVCYIHVSGYRGFLAASQAKMERIASRCTEQFRQLYGELSPNAPTMEQVRAFIAPLEYMLLELFRLHLAHQSSTGTANSLYLKALEYIHEYYPNPISCQVIARELGYSESYVRSIFKKEGGSSVQTVINRVRLNSAKRLLRTTGLSVTEIAFSVGFADSNYFSAFFKKQEGKTPKEYRKGIIS